MNDTKSDDYRAGYRDALAGLRSSEQAAKELGLSRPGLNAASRQLGVGTIIGTNRVFTEEDMARLRNRRTDVGPIPRDQRKDTEIVDYIPPADPAPVQHLIVKPNSTPEELHRLARAAFASDQLVHITTEGKVSGRLFEVLGVSRDGTGIACIEWLHDEPRTHRLWVIPPHMGYTIVHTPYPVPGSGPDGERTYDERHGGRLMAGIWSRLKSRRDIVRFEEPETNVVE